MVKLALPTIVDDSSANSCAWCMPPAPEVGELEVVVVGGGVLLLLLLLMPLPPPPALAVRRA